MELLEESEMNTLIIDVETTIFQKGNPYSQRNELVCIGLKLNDNPVEVYYKNYEFESSLVRIKDIFNIENTTLVGFNLKFDLSWLERAGLYSPTKNNYRYWDCQLVEFLLNRQQTPYPDLNSVCEKYNLGKKLDVIYDKYWKNNIDTNQIPRQELTEYLIQDINLTYNLYKKQVEVLPKSMERITSLMNQDVAVLQQMETNGLYLDVDKVKAKNEEITKEINNIEQKLLLETEVKGQVNWSSHDEVSKVLYGGVVEFTQPVQVGFYKSGAKAGQPRYKYMTYSCIYPQLIKPIKNSELSKDGFWSTDIATLKQLKTNKKTKEIVNLIMKRSELMKLSSTYLKNLPELIVKMDWKQNKLHGRFNQCVAITGRLSSSSPNLQNLPSELKQFIKSEQR